ncbi:MAG: nickel-type superoxide dismutase maturation protease [Candidatus Hodarchaeales archaeon]
MISSFFPFSFFKVTGNSMEPTLSAGDYVFLLKSKRLKNNDIVVVRKPGSDRMIIKRVLNHRKNKIFVIGDNQKASTDSRSFGSICRQQVLGRVIFALRKPKN